VTPSTSVEDHFAVIEVPAEATLASIQTRLEQMQAPRVALYLPQGCRALSNPVQFAALRRTAARLGLSLALVTRDPRLRSLSKLGGLPAFGSVAAAERARLNGRIGPATVVGLPNLAILNGRKRAMQGRGHPARAGVARRRGVPRWLANVGLFMFLLGMVAVVGLAMLLLVPFAEVTLIPAREPLTAVVPITADLAITQPDFGARLIPARRVAVDVEGTGEIATSGRRNAPADRAKGKVVFINRRAQEVVVPLGTIVGTSTGDNVRFRTTITATLPAVLGGTAEAEIEAVDPGPRGNVRPFTINNVEGPLGLLVRVVNEAPTAGGTLSEVPVVTQADKDRLREATERQLQQAAYVRLSEILQAGEFVPPATVGTVILSETFDRFAGEAAPVLRVKLRVRARGLAVDGGSARAIAQSALANLVPPEGRLLAEGLSIQPGPVTSASAERVQFTMNASGFAVRRVDTWRVRRLLYGLAIQDAGPVLERHLALQASPVISVGPDWYVERFGLMPLLPWRIRVQVRYGDVGP